MSETSQVITQVSSEGAKTTEPQVIGWLGQRVVMMVVDGEGEWRDRSVCGCVGGCVFL